MHGILKKMLRHGQEEQKPDTLKDTSSTLDDGANMFTYKLIEVWSFLMQVDEEKCCWPLIQFWIVACSGSYFAVLDCVEHIPLV